jgi:hypothetical protein
LSGGDASTFVSNLTQTIADYNAAYDAHASDSDKSVTLTILGSGATTPETAPANQRITGLYAAGECAISNQYFAGLYAGSGFGVGSSAYNGDTGRCQ